jgi:hypothetical protein
MAHAFFPKCLSNHCQGLCQTFSEICTTFDAAHPAAWNFVHWFPRHANTNHVPLHHATTTTAVQRAAQVPKIMDTPSYDILI